MPETYQPFDWYRIPLFYDIIFDVETDAETRFIEAMYRRHVTGGQRRLLEPACGSGRLLAALAKRGFRVTGFDLSEGMLDFARSRLASTGQAGHLSRQRMEDFSYAQKFDLAHCLVSTFKYLLTEEAARAHLQRVADHLLPGGIYVLGFHLSDYARETRERERWVANRSGTHVVCNIQSWPPEPKQRLERVRSRLSVKNRGKSSVERYETDWMFRTYDNRQFRRLLGSVPDLEMVATHDFFYQPDELLDFDREDHGVVVILQRRETTKRAVSGSRARKLPTAARRSGKPTKPAKPARPARKKTV